MSLQNSKQNSQAEISLDEHLGSCSRTSLAEEEINNKQNEKYHHITSKTDKSKETKQISNESEKESYYFNEGEIFYQKSNVRDFIG